MGRSGSRCFLPSLDFRGDVAYVLGRNTGDEGQLCGDFDDNGDMVNAINKWSKYKSFRNPTKGFPVDITQLTPALRQPEMETALKAKNCGLAMRSYGSSDAAWAAAMNLVEDGSDWIHVPPRGISYNPKELFRINDFDGYNGAAAAPFQFGPSPNPAWITDTITINDSAGSGAADITMADLLGDDTAVDTHYSYRNIRSYVIFSMLGKRVSGAMATAPSIIFRQNSQVPKARLSDGTWDCVTVFVDPTTAALIEEGLYISTNGTFILAPVGRRSFVYYENYGFADNGTYFQEGLTPGVGTVHLMIKALHNINWSLSLGVQFYANGAWGSTITLVSSSGSISKNDTRSWAQLANNGPTQYRMVIDGTEDRQSFTIAYTPAVNA